MYNNPLYFIASLSLALALVVIVLGAYVRLSHAGLGCPDWPGCYGELIVPDTVSELNHLYSERPLEQSKAWKEMTHRYAAAILGLLILLLAIIAWRSRSQQNQPVILTTVLLLLVIFQTVLGMWTVTLLLKPVIVMGHLLGGMTILVLLFWLVLDQQHVSKDTVMPGLQSWVIVGMIILICQIGLGGWTSANYAAVACPDFPTCHGVWWPAMDFTEGFTFWHGLGVDYEGGILAGEARTAIHMSHRIGAIVTVIVLVAVAIRALREQHPKAVITGKLLLILLFLQIGLGITNIVHILPLPVAVAHNAVAALLLLTMVFLLFHSTRAR